MVHAGCVFVAGIRHECQDLLSPCDGMRCAQTRPRFILSSESFRGMASEPMLTPRKEIPAPEKFSPEEDRACIKQDSEPNTLPTSYSGPAAALQACSHSGQQGTYLGRWIETVLCFFLSFLLLFCLFLRTVPTVFCGKRASDNC